METLKEKYKNKICYWDPSTGITFIVPPNGFAEKPEARSSGTEVSSGYYAGSGKYIIDENCVLLHIKAAEDKACLVTGTEFNEKQQNVIRQLMLEHGDGLSLFLEGYLKENEQSVKTFILSYNFYINA